jgi:hypothetical protein
MVVSKLPTGVEYGLFDKCSVAIDECKIAISSPWLEITLDVQRDVSATVLAEIQRRELLGTYLFPALFEYPLFYSKPRRVTHPTVQLTNCTRLKLTTPRSALLSLGKPESLDSSAFADDERWHWSLESILANSAQGEDRFDPLAVYFQTLRFRLEDQKSVVLRAKMLSELSNAVVDNPDRFLGAMILLIGQNRYVTSKCYDSISPAVCFSRIEDIVSNFLREEAGHDELMELSLKVLGGGKLPHYDLLPQSVYSMSSLEYASQESPLALACLLGIFEGSSVGDKDPLSALLAQGGYPDACKGLDIHYEINKVAQHSAVGIGIAGCEESVSKAECAQAIRLTELVHRLQDSIAAHVIASLK